MVKITLYNIGGYKKKQVFYCFVGFFCIRFQIFKKSKEDMYLGERIQVLRCFGYTRIKISPYGHWDCMSIISVSFYDVRFPIEYQHSIWSNVLWLRRVNLVFKKINIVVSKNIYIMYIYINSTLVSTIHIT